jgi:hypothetical protein
MQVSLQFLWRMIRLVLVIQVFNAVIDYFTWVTYGYSVPSGTIATLTVFYTILVLAIKAAIERDASIPS